jgi:hypothetical protein
MARTSDLFETGPGGTYIYTIAPSGYDILINGTSKYLNFNTVVGVTGYGIRDNAGTIQIKNSGGGWADLVSLGFNQGIGVAVTDATEGSIFFAGPGGILAQDNAKLFYNSATGNVGIGTTVPGGLINSTNASVLSIRGTQPGIQLSLLATGQSSEITNTSAGTYFDIAGAATASNNFMSFRVGNTNSSYSVSEAMRITSASYVGIGTAAPGTRLTVAGAISLPNDVYDTVPALSLTPLAGEITGQRLADSNFGFLRLSAGGGRTDTTYKTAIDLMGYASTDDFQIRFYTVGTEKVRINKLGNFGIGTTGPTAVLHLKAGTATASTAPFKLTSGTVNTTAEAGALEYNGTNLSFVPTGTLRENIHTGGRGNITLTAGTTTTVTDATAKTTSTIMLTPTSLGFTALSGYVSTKSNGSFVITTTMAVGTETLDYIIIN